MNDTVLVPAKNLGAPQMSHVRIGCLVFANSLNLTEVHHICLICSPSLTSVTVQ